jgi:hypothetical protein
MDNITNSFNLVELGRVDLINLAQVTVSWQTDVGTTLIIQVP